MTYSERRINSKIQARAALKGNWGKSIAVWLLLFAVIAGITILSVGTLFAASPDDFEIAVSPSGLHTTALAPQERLELFTEQFSLFIDKFSETGEADFDIFTVSPIDHTSPVGTTIITVFSLLISLMTLIISFGIYKFYLSLVERDETGVGLIFTYFGSAKKFFGCILFTLLLTLITALWGLLFGVVWFIIFTSATICLYISLTTSSTYGIVILFAALILYIVSAVAFGIFLYRYQASTILFIKNGGVLFPIKKSKFVMKGHKWEYFVFELSFIGWWLLTILTCGILAIYVLPYYTASQTAFISSLIGKDRPLGSSDEPMPDIPNFTEFLS